MTDFVAGFFAPWIIYALILVLHLVLPARKVVGYVRDDRHRQAAGVPAERTAGARACWCCSGSLLGRTGVLAWDWLYVHRWSGLVGSCVLGLLFSFAMVLTAPSTGRSFLADLYFGRCENRQFFGAQGGRQDVPLPGRRRHAGAEPPLLHGASRPEVRIGLLPGVLLYCILFCGSWSSTSCSSGCTSTRTTSSRSASGSSSAGAASPSTRTSTLVGLWATADLPDPGTPWWLLVVFALVFFAGWALSRGANMQKYYFKTRPERAFLGFIEAAGP